MAIAGDGAFFYCLAVADASMQTIAMTHIGTAYHHFGSFLAHRAAAAFFA